MAIHFLPGDPAVPHGDNTGTPRLRPWVGKGAAGTCGSKATGSKYKGLTCCTLSMEGVNEPKQLWKARSWARPEIGNFLRRSPEEIWDKFGLIIKKNGMELKRTTFKSSNWCVYILYIYYMYIINICTYYTLQKSIPKRSVLDSGDQDFPSFKNH